jgi:hypothetical protein
MEYAIAFVVGLFCGGLAVWLLVMGYFEKGSQKDKAGRAALATAKLQSDAASAQERELLDSRRQFQRELADFQARVISYDELQQENTLLKRDLQNMDVTTNKLELDGEIRQSRYNDIDDRSKKLASRYLAETVKAVVAAMGPSNFSACKQRLSDVIERCREIGFEVSSDEEAKLMADLRREFEKEVRLAFEREEQARIKAQIREEEKLKREIDRELQQLERERVAIQAALDQALATANGAHSLEVDQLKARLTETEEKSKRKLSMAQQTKSGHVYVLSNIGSLGVDVFKVGMSRRTNPLERVSELSNASVPFPFDVHMMISTANAPGLENALHRALRKCRINKANPRKEFFRASIKEIYEIVARNHGEVQYVADPEALEYTQSQTMSDADANYIDDVFEKVEGEMGLENGED